MRVALVAILTLLLVGLPVRADDPKVLELPAIPGLNEGAMIDLDNEVDSPPSPSITLAELESTAIAGHPAIAIARHRIDAARGPWLQAG